MNLLNTCPNWLEQGRQDEISLSQQQYRVLLSCLKLTFEALSIVLISVILHKKNQTFIESCGYRLDLFSAFQFHASLFSVFYILSTYCFDDRSVSLVQLWTCCKQSGAFLVVVAVLDGLIEDARSKVQGPEILRFSSALFSRALVSAGARCYHIYSRRATIFYLSNSSTFFSQIPYI